MSMLSHSEDEIKRLYKEGLITYQAVRDYQALKSLQSGKTIPETANALGVSVRTIERIRQRWG